MNHTSGLPDIGVGRVLLERLKVATEGGHEASFILRVRNSGVTYEPHCYMAFSAGCIILCKERNCNIYDENISV
jgi:hypothetical protein